MGQSSVLAVTVLAVTVSTGTVSCYQTCISYSPKPPTHLHGNTLPPLAKRCNSPEYHNEKGLVSYLGLLHTHARTHTCTHTQTHTHTHLSIWWMYYNDPVSLKLSEVNTLVKLAVIQSHQGVRCDSKDKTYYSRSRR